MSLEGRAAEQFRGPGPGLYGTRICFHQGRPSWLVFWPFRAPEAKRPWGTFCFGGGPVGERRSKPMQGPTEALESIFRPSGKVSQKSMACNWSEMALNWFAVAFNWFAMALNWFAVACNWSAVACNLSAVAFNWSEVALNWSAVAFNWSAVACNWSAVACNWSEVGFN